MRTTIRRVCTLTTVGVVLATAAPAAAAAAVTVSVPAEAELTAGLLVTVPVTVTCGPYEELSSSYVSVSISQAAKKGIATGQASYGMFGLPPQLTCDGALEVIEADVVADTSGVPFRRGDAIVAVHASFAMGCCTSDTATAGPQEIRLR